MRWCLALVLLCACEKEVIPPAAPGGGGNPHANIGTGQVGTGDGGSSDVGSGESDADAGPTLGCAAIEDGDTDNHVTLVDDNDDEIEFEEIAVFAIWDPEACEDREAVLVVGFTADSCVPGQSQQLRFLIPEDSASTIDGPNSIDGAGDDEFNIRFDQPNPPDADDLWGNCTGSFGDVTFTDVGVEDGTVMEASFDLTLTDCANDGDNPPITASGEFSVEVEQDFDDACPGD